MLEYAEKVVIPALTDAALTRARGANRYFLHDVGFVSMPEEGQPVPLLLVYGRFVHTTVLRRTQVFRDGTLAPDRNEMESAPSAFFALILNNHKLIYVYETPFAPSMDRFAATIRRFFHIKHREFLNAEYQALKVSGQPATRSQLSILHPYPEVDVIPLSNPDSITQFIARFSVLRRIEIQILRPNQEIQAELVWRGLEERRERIRATKTLVSHENGKGLDKTVAVTQIEEAAASGNQRVQLTGKDEAGNPLRGDNENLRVEAELELPEPDGTKATVLAESYQALIQSGVIHADRPAGNQNSILRRLLSIFLRGDQT